MLSIAATNTASEVSELKMCFFPNIKHNLIPSRKSTEDHFMRNNDYRCRKEDDIDVSWKHDNYFFPNDTSFNIIDIVHFIKYNLPHLCRK